MNSDTFRPTNTSARRLAWLMASGALALALSGCGDDAATSTTTTAAVATTTASGAVTTDAPGASTTAATSAGSGTRLDSCAQTAPDTVAATFVSSINYAGADTYMQCVFEDTVPESIGPKVKAKNFSSLSPAIDAATNSYVYTAADGSKLTLTLTKEANGKFYVTAAALG